MNRQQLVVCFLILVASISIRFFFFYQNKSQFKDGQFVKFQTTLLSEPQIFGKYQRLTANFNSEKIFITTSRFPEFHYGQNLEISGSIRFFQSGENSIQNEKLLSGKKIVLTMSFPQIKAIQSDQNFILAFASSIRQNIIFLFEKTLPPTSSSLLLGIVFGVKAGMPKEFTEALRLTGVFHVIAASGMNVTMVAGFSSSVFTFFLKRQYALVLTILGICFYAVLAGLEPSIIRASIMGILAFSAQVLGRQREASYSLFLAGFVMLFISPNLIFDIGFQLSFLSTLGLLYLPALFERNKRVGKLIKKSLIGEDVVTTLSAQIATLPIILLNFGTYSLWSVLVNGLALWTIPFLMVLGGVGAIFGMIVEPFGQLFLYLSLPFLIFFQKVVSLFSGFGGIVVFNNFPWQLTVGYYALLLAILMFFRSKKEV